MQEQLSPSPTQTTTLIIIAIYVVVIAVFWNVPYLKEVLLPFKIFTVALHEFGGCVLTKDMPRREC